MWAAASALTLLLKSDNLWTGYVWPIKLLTIQLKLNLSCYQFVDWFMLDKSSIKIWQPNFLGKKIESCKIKNLFTFKII